MLTVKYNKSFYKKIKTINTMILIHPKTIENKNLHYCLS